MRREHVPYRFVVAVIGALDVPADLRDGQVESAQRPDCRRSRSSASGPYRRWPPALRDASGSSPRSE